MNPCTKQQPASPATLVNYQKGQYLIMNRKKINWKKCGLKLLFPPKWMLFLFTIIAAVTLSAVFFKGWETSPIAYIIYVFSFYTLTVDCVFFSIVFPKQYRKMQQKISESKYGNRYKTDIAFHTHLWLYISLAFKVIYICTNLISFFLSRSMWFAIFTGYYATLAIMLFLLLRYLQQNELGKNILSEWKRARLCSYILLSINFALSGAVLMILYQNKSFEYNGFLIYAMAAYTFYITIRSIINVIKYRNNPSPILKIRKVINLSAALVSMLALETAMFAQFGADMLPQHKWIFVALTGAGVSIIVVTLSLSMILRSTKEIKSLRSNHYE